MAGTTGNQEVARRYARAFFELAQEQGADSAQSKNAVADSAQSKNAVADSAQSKDAVDDIANDMTALEGVLATGGDFTAFLHNATLKRDDQVRALAEITKQLKLSPLTGKLLGTLAAKRRLPALGAVVAAVQSLVAAHKGEVTADVTAAQALDQAQISEIAASLKKALGLTVKVRLDVDPSIMGGLIVKVGSKLMDSSVRTRLERLHRALKQTNALSDKAKMKEVA